MALTEGIILPQAAKIKTKIGEARWHKQVGSDHKKQSSPGSLFVLVDLGLPAPWNAKQPSAQAGVLSQETQEASLFPEAGDSLFPTSRGIRQPTPPPSESNSKDYWQPVSPDKTRPQSTSRVQDSHGKPEQCECLLK